MAVAQWALLKGNIAPAGIRIRLDGLPAPLHGFRGPVRRFQGIMEAARALENGEIAVGTALLFSGEGLEPGWTDGFSRALETAGRLQAACVLTDAPLDAAEIRGAYLSDAGREGLSLLRDGDMLEYDIDAGTISLDLPEEGLAQRLSGGTEETFVVREVEEGVWSILDRYSRMFLVAGKERALLIDTGFGTADPRPLIASLTGLPYEVVLTHGHWDHAGGADYFQEVWLREADWPLARDAAARPVNCRFRPLQDGQRFRLGARELRALACPGHTRGCMVLFDQDNGLLFSGDAVAQGPTYLFMEHCSLPDQAASMRRLAEIQGQVRRIYPAHHEMGLDAGYITEMEACARSVLEGKLKGTDTCIGRLNAVCKTYRLGRCSIYY